MAILPLGAAGAMPFAECRRNRNGIVDDIE
jgi:hypothetical protein